MNVAVVDIGTPGANFGWAMAGNITAEGTDIDQCVETLASVLPIGPLALGFEAPLFVPIRTDPKRLTTARKGESGKGMSSRPFSAGAGAAALVSGIVVVSYILSALRQLAPQATATLDWKSPAGSNQLLLFEAFVTNQRKTADTRHVEDASLAIEAFQRAMRDPQACHSAIDEPVCLSLLGATMLRTGWETDLTVLSKPCLVVRA